MATKRGNVPTQSWRGKSAVFRIYSALTSNGYIKAVRRQRNLGLNDMMHASLTMIAINKLTDRTGADSEFFFPEITGNGHKNVFPNVKTINAAVKTHTRRCLRS